jgi:hypothetical protein
MQPVFLHDCESPNTRAWNSLAYFIDNFMNNLVTFASKADCALICRVIGAPASEKLSASTNCHPREPAAALPFLFIFYFCNTEPFFQQSTLHSSAVGTPLALNYRSCRAGSAENNS